MALQTIQNDNFQNDNFGANLVATEYNEAWTVMDEEQARRDFYERLDIYVEFDEDGIPF